MDALLFRSGGWFLAFLLAVAAAALAIDTPFAIQMGIVAAAALITLAATLVRTDMPSWPDGPARPLPPAIMTMSSAGA